MQSPPSSRRAFTVRVFQGASRYLIVDFTALKRRVTQYQPPTPSKVQVKQRPCIAGRSPDTVSHPSFCLTVGDLKHPKRLAVSAVAC